LSLSPLGAAIDQATSSVFFSIAFLYQTKSGPTREAIDRLMNKSVFSYGISDKQGGLTVRKPDGTFGIVNFNYLAGITPMPFKAEWSGGKGIHEHHKFVVTDFSLPSAKVFTGSSNLSPSGEAGNGDNLVMIEDCRVATSYAIEALRVFDHLHFRTVMSDAFAGVNKDDGKAGAARTMHSSAAGARTTKRSAKTKAAKKSAKKGKIAKAAAPTPKTAVQPSKTAAMAALTLKKPTAISGKPPWFTDFYKAGTQREHDRKLFSH
jgi:PLD-like domain